MTDVSRETLEALEFYVTELLRWNRRINLVARNEVEVIRDRHIADSRQIERLAPPSRHWVDLGSGGGLPAIVVAILRKDDETDFTLIESDNRKCAFLRSVSRQLSLNVTVLANRIEFEAAVGGDTVSARALAPLPILLDYAVRHLADGGLLLFPKGETWEKEVGLAQETWQFDLESRPSQTRAGAAILMIRNARRR